MKIVAHALFPMAIGSVQTMRWDATAQPIEHPVLIVREATRADYVESALAWGGDKSLLGNGPFYYEVTTD